MRCLKHSSHPSELLKLWERVQYHGPVFLDQTVAYVGNGIPYYTDEPWSKTHKAKEQSALFYQQELYASLQNPVNAFEPSSQFKTI